MREATRPRPGRGHSLEGRSRTRCSWPPVDSDNYPWVPLGSKAGQLDGARIVRPPRWQGQQKMA